MTTATVLPPDDTKACPACGGTMTRHLSATVRAVTLFGADSCFM
jgi:hypothetical protein